MKSKIEFKITHADKVQGGCIKTEDSISEHYQIFKRNEELVAVNQAYNEGLIILKFEWNNEIENDVIRLILYRGKVEYE